MSVTKGSARDIAGVLYLWTYIVVVVMCMNLLLNTCRSVEHMHVWCPQGPQAVKAVV